VVIYLRETSASKSYFDDAKRIRSEILSVLSRVKPKVIVDVGVGESTKNLLSNTPGLIIAVDLDCEKLIGFPEEISSSNTVNELMLVCCDTLHLPLRLESIDLVLLYFVLHEINPKLHMDTLAGIKKVSKYTLIVEPIPNGNELYRRMCTIWRDAMRSVGKFEEYREPEYWLQLLDRLNFHIVEKRIISWKTTVPHEVLKTVISSWISEWRRINMPKEFIKQLEMFLEETKEFRWSDILVVLASSK
jgi:ubiquinone/menaquinone biosynthesis C-methylase UbiE